MKQISQNTHTHTHTRSVTHTLSHTHALAHTRSLLHTQTQFKSTYQAYAAFGTQNVRIEKVHFYKSFSVFFFFDPCEDQ